MIKEKFLKGWPYKLLYRREMYEPTESENPYARMGKEYLWCILMRKGKGRKRQ